MSVTGLTSDVVMESVATVDDATSLEVAFDRCSRSVYRYQNS